MHHNSDNAATLGRIVPRPEAVTDPLDRSSDPAVWILRLPLMSGISRYQPCVPADVSRATSPASFSFCGWNPKRYRKVALTYVHGVVPRDRERRAVTAERDSLAKRRIDILGSSGPAGWLRRRHRRRGAMTRRVPR